MNLRLVSLIADRCLSRNLSNSNKTRTADNSSCIGSASAAPSNSDNSSPCSPRSQLHGYTRPPYFPPDRAHSLVRSCGPSCFAETNFPARARQVQTPVPQPGFSRANTAIKLIGELFRKKSEEFRKKFRQPSSSPADCYSSSPPQSSTRPAAATPSHICRDPPL